MGNGGSRLALLAMVAGACGGSVALGRVDVLMEPGQAAPGMPPGVTFDIAGIGVVTIDGLSAIPGRVVGPGITEDNDQGLWVGGVDGIELLTRTGSQAPGTADGVLLSAITQPVRLNAGGEAAFQATLSGPGVTGSNNRGIWAGGLGALELVARTGAHASGTAANVTFSSLDTGFVFNNLGQTAFVGQLNAPFGTEQGIWHGGAGSVQLLARKGSPAPGTAGNFGDLNPPVLNNAGQAAFHSLASSGESGIWLGSPGELALAFGSGQQVPGAEAGVTFGGVDTPMLNDAGELAFFGSASDGRSGLWAGTTEHVEFVGGEGVQAPGTPEGTHYLLLLNPTIGGGGHVSFSAGLGGPGVDMSNNLALFAGRPGEVQLVARRGSQAPHTAEGVHFTNFGFGTMFNSSGVMAFGADLAGPGVDTSNSRGLYMADSTGESVLVARAGDIIAGHKLFFFIIGNAASGGEDGRASTLNEHGQLLYFASFTDGSRRSILYTPELRWRRDAGGDWDDTDNWTLSLPPAHVHDVTIDPSVNLSVTGPGSDRAVRNLSVGGGAGAAMLDLQSGVTLSVVDELTIASNGTVASAGRVEASRAEIAGGGKFDLVGGELLLRDQALEEAAALVLRGYDSGTWQGDGITSSTAAGDPARAVGYGPVAEGILVKDTFAGDATLDGAVTIADLGVLAANWQQSERSWQHGDFNFDGMVTIADLGILAANWQAGTAGGSGMSFGEAMAMFDAFDGVVVPEPAGVGLLLLGAGALGIRRRRG